MQTAASQFLPSNKYLVMEQQLTFSCCRASLAKGSSSLLKLKLCPRATPRDFSLKQVRDLVTELAVAVAADTSTHVHARTRACTGNRIKCNQHSKSGDEETTKAFCLLSFSLLSLSLFQAVVPPDTLQNVQASHQSWQEAGDHL